MTDIDPTVHCALYLLQNKGLYGHLDVSSDPLAVSHKRVFIGSVFANVRVQHCHML